MGERREGRSFAATCAVRKSQVFGTVTAFHGILDRRRRNGSKTHQETAVMNDGMLVDEGSPNQIGE